MSFATLFRRLAAVAAVGAVGFSANAQPITYMGPDGTYIQGERCATPVPTLDEALAIEAQVAAHLEASPNAAARTGVVEIPVAFHVVYGNGGVGNVSDQMIADQMDVLNDAFAPHGYQFNLSVVTRTQNQTWFTGCGGASENPMKQALHVDPATTFNIYSCQPGGGILGYAYLPSTFPEDDFRHGIVILHSSMPGGSAAPYNLGDTATHEAGHYLGLYHTFDNGCSPGDFVDDTEPEANPRFGCPDGATSCSTPDPIYNFMDYTDDACMNHFTVGQKERADVQMATFRPTMYIKVPVELTSFTAHLDGTTARLRWETASETNNAGFEVQVRKDGQNTYAPVGYVEGHGTTTEAQSYGYTVDGLEPGRHFFRLKQVDFDGQTAYHGDVEVVVDVPGTYVLEAAYPNPFNPMASFRFAVSNPQHVRATLVDMLGREVRALYDGTPAADEFQTVYIDGAGLPSGAYLIRVTGETFAETQTVTLLK